MRRVNVIIFLFVALLSLAAFLTFSRAKSYDKIESLHAPVALQGWSADGLVATDGRTIAVPGVCALPDKSPALKELTQRGVELNRDGRVYALVRVHHWCGNDPVREHIARVDLSEALLFLRVGQPVAPIPEPESAARTAGGRFSEWGWNVSEFIEFQAWEQLKNLRP